MDDTNLTSNMDEKRDEDLKYQVTHDILTKLPNKMLFTDRLEQAIAQAQREHQKVIVAYLDLDRFKDVNDHDGHAAGDRLLTLVAQRIKKVLRASDTLARLGGDEFVILLPQLKDIQHIPLLLNAILNAVSKPYSINRKEYQITCSLGFSIYPDDSLEPEVLINHADMAMYQAKALGKNTIQGYTKTLHEHLSKRMELERSLEDALNNHNLTLVYQPKISADTRLIVGAEALLRWQHPTLGSIPSDVFISIANETGLIIPIGAWSLENACTQNKVWQQAGLPPIPISVNISNKQFKFSNLCSQVTAVLKKTHLEPQYLELELTESIIMDNPTECINIIKMLKELGISISLDDFGTGYTSLNYLRQFQLDFLKIDGSFIQHLSDKNNTLAIIQAMINLGHLLNMHIIAEGVETEEQANALKEIGCDFLQGYFFSQPVTAEAFATLLAQQVGVGR